MGCNRYNYSENPKLGHASAKHPASCFVILFYSCATVRYIVVPCITSKYRTLMYSNVRLDPNGITENFECIERVRLMSMCVNSDPTIM